MTFDAIPPQSSVFVDANTFVYHFSQHPTLALPCTNLLDRMARREISGVTSADVLSDVAHRLMALEAASALGWTGPGAVMPWNFVLRICLRFGVWDFEPIVISGPCGSLRQAYASFLGYLAP
jgi:hypothetical protein